MKICHHDFIHRSDNIVIDFKAKDEISAGIQKNLMQFIHSSNILSLITLHQFIDQFNGIIELIIIHILSNISLTIRDLTKVNLINLLCLFIQLIHNGRLSRRICNSLHSSIYISNLITTNLISLHLLECLQDDFIRIEFIHDFITLLSELILLSRSSKVSFLLSFSSHCSQRVMSIINITIKNDFHHLSFSIIDSKS